MQNSWYVVDALPQEVNCVSFVLSKKHLPEKIDIETAFVISSTHYPKRLRLLLKVYVYLLIDVLLLFLC